MTTQTITNFQPTLMQKLLGRNYKWWYIILCSYRSSSGNFNTFVFSTFVRTIEFLAIIYIWKINDSPATLITYLALGRVFDRLSFMEIQGQLQSLISRGGITKCLLRPTDVFGYLICDNIGFNFIRASINSIIIFICSIILFGSDIIISVNILYLLLFFFVTYIIKTYFALLTGSIAFWLKDNANAVSIINSIEVGAGLFSGEIIPLFVFFKAFWSPIYFTPFAFMLHHPMQIYLGKYTPVETFYVFLGGIVWCIILYFLAKWVFKIGLKKNEAVGL